MAPHARDGRAHPPTTAVVQVAEDGSVTLYLGTEPVEHAKGIDPAAVMQILVDYAATIDERVRVTTQMPGGSWTRHELHQDGTLSPLPRDLPAAPTRVRSIRNTEASRSQRRAWPRIKTRAAHGWLLAMLILLVAALMAVVATI